MKQDADIVIVGAGLSGLVAALRLAEAGKKVILLESGSEQPSEIAQALNTGETNGDRFTDPGLTRTRALGGTLHQWEIHLKSGVAGGRLVSLEAQDFEGHPDEELSRWPFSLDELDPYYEQAKKRLHVDQLCQKPAEQGPLATKLKGSGLVFGEYGLADFRDLISRWKLEIGQSENIDLRLNTTVIDYLLNEAGDQILGVVTKPTDGAAGEEKISAEQVILAGGVIENARQLLLHRSHPSWPEGLGNNAGFVGKAYMDHAIVPLCAVSLPEGLTLRDMVFFDRQQEQQGERIGYMTFAEDFRKEQDLASLGMIWTPMPKWMHSRGMKALKNVIKGEIGELGKVFRHADEIGAWLMAKLTRPRLFGLNQVGWTERPEEQNQKEFTHWMIACTVEQWPSLENKIELSEQKDNFDQEKVKIQWTFGERDRKRLEQTQRKVIEKLNHAGFQAREVKATNFSGTHHHFGGARMSEDSEKGVTDPYGKVHGVKNLWLAGNSPACSCGMVNPALTNVALTLRLAEELVKR